MSGVEAKICYELKEVEITLKKIITRRNSGGTDSHKPGTLCRGTLHVQRKLMRYSPVDVEEECYLCYRLFFLILSLSPLAVGRFVNLTWPGSAGDGGGVVAPDLRWSVMADVDRERVMILGGSGGGRGICDDEATEGPGTALPDDGVGREIVRMVIAGTWRWAGAVDFCAVGASSAVARVHWVGYCACGNGVSTRNLRPRTVEVSRSSLLMLVLDPQSMQINLLLLPEVRFLHSCPQLL